MRIAYPKALVALAIAGTTLLSGCGAVESLDNSFAEWNWSGCTPEERNKWKQSGETPPVGDGCYDKVYPRMSREQWQEWEEIQEKYYSTPETSPLDEMPRGGVYDRCHYDPTMNDDWHDDMVCDGQRLYLRGWDDFVTEAELWKSAARWVRRHGG